LSSTLSGRALDVSSAAYYFACVLAIEAVRQSHDGDWDAVARKAEAIGMARVGELSRTFPDGTDAAPRRTHARSGKGPVSRAFHGGRSWIRTRDLRLIRAAL
jgi:hypothetical protein